MKEAWALGEERISQCLTLFLYFHVPGRNFSLYTHTYDFFFPAYSSLDNRIDSNGAPPGSNFPVP